MYRILSSSKDTYITDKIIGSSTRVTDANVGRAGTLDLFKLYDETPLSGTTAPIEISRILIKFDLEPLRQLTGSTLNLNDNSFKCFLKLHDVYGGQTVPTNFKLILFPLSKSFDEGFGRDVSSFQDLDAANFITASSTEGIVPWELSGANKQGLLGSNDIDIISSGVIDTASGIQNLWVEQTFSTGEEDLHMDITTIVSATLVGLIPDHGFRISFSGSQETDNRTRFVKRFATRHSTNPNLRPKIIASYDDSLQDDHENMFFDLSGSLFLNNTHRGSLSNILSGSSLIPLQGPNCLLVTLTSGTFSSSYTASQHAVGGNYVPGIYSATFALSSQDSNLRNEILNAGSATFSEVWTSIDSTQVFLSSTLIVRSINRTGFNARLPALTIVSPNTKKAYHRDEKVRFRIFVQDNSVDTNFKYTKGPIEKKSKFYKEMFYQIRDVHSNHVVIPFETIRNTTKVSVDSLGMYFDVFMDSLPIGRVYDIDILIKEQGIDQQFRGIGARFRVDV